MNPPEDNEKDIQRRERELTARENAVRLREIEAEIDRSYQQAKLVQTKKQFRSDRQPQRWGRKLIKITKFSGFVILVVFLMRFAMLLAAMAIFGTVAWVGYKLFLEEDEGEMKKR